MEARKVHKQMRKPPEVVKFGHRKITVKLGSPDKDQYLADCSGYAIYEADTVVLRKTLSNGLARATLLHELLHLIIDASAPSDQSPSPEDAEHWFIGVLENPLITILQENPQLVEYLLHND
jgi:hypothetical protein